MVHHLEQVILGNFLIMLFLNIRWIKRKHNQGIGQVERKNTHGGLQYVSTGDAYSRFPWLVKGDIGVCFIWDQVFELHVSQLILSYTA